MVISSEYAADSENGIKITGVQEPNHEVARFHQLKVKLHVV